MPSIAFANCHITSGSSGLAKLRQSVIATGYPPHAVILREHSVTASSPPVKGSKYVYLEFPFTFNKKPFLLFLLLLALNTAAEKPGGTMVAVPMV